MRVPDSPEPMEALRARFPAAIARVWDIDSADYDVDNGPGKQRENVFDTTSGLRFIVSRDKQHSINNGQPHLLHVSVSFRGGSEVEQVLRGCASQEERRDALLRVARNTFAEISGLKLPERPSHVSPGGVLHWELADAVPSPGRPAQQPALSCRPS